MGRFAPELSAVPFRPDRIPPMLTLLEAVTYWGLPTIVTGLIALVVLISALGWVIGMGSGRPHSK